VQFRGVKTFHFVQFEGEKLSILCSLLKKYRIFAPKKEEK
jgi:hypothetical protein